MHRTAARLRDTGSSSGPREVTGFPVAVDALIGVIDIGSIVDRA
jgi:hypothetical protein